MNTEETTVIRRGPEAGAGRRGEGAAGPRPLNVGGFVPLSTGDFPGRLAAVVFCQGCPWRCRYCHNPHLQPANTGTSLEWSALRSWLDRRRGLLDAVVFSGGEPTAQAGLRRALQEVRKMGFQTGLHTAGIYPRRLERLLPLLDWIGFDVKAESLNYESITGVRGSGGAAIRSLDLVLESGIACEMRTTVHPDLLSAESLWRVAESLARRGARHFVVQEFRAAGCMDGVLRERAASGYLVPGQLRDMARLFATFEVRRS